MKLKLFILALVAVTFVRATPPLEEGKTIFAARCASCHNINKVVVGPALANVHERHSIDWIVNFVHSPQTLIKNGDKAAVALFNQFNHIQMPDHPDLTADNIKNIVEYIKSESTAAPADAAPFVKPLQVYTAYQPLSIHNYGFFIGYLFVVALLIAGLLIAVQVKSFERKMQKSDES